ncbi:hypothetical protein OLMES_3694 [Oleiphilus messinensis]|uniref:Uncharacterized protein n=1 Tax=Oleiphilus messinensis TaxID=141451 RepID=A0A1Y0IDZ8_9GAMM|nr:hypothetical protein [Oleiphilus messinensis]ARU57715.1 hypothetical protein OLMES_3694 [Oleiphilus messinensis]
MSKYLFTYVCQHGLLEIQAMLLTVSLVRYAKCEHEIVAGIPHGQLEPESLQLLAKLNVKTVSIEPTVTGYLNSHKIALLEKVTEDFKAEYYLLMDSDILCQANFSGIDMMSAHDIALRVAGISKTWKDIQQWGVVYDLFEMPYPASRVISTYDRTPMWPYYNAGVICIRHGVAFPEAWRKACLKIEAADHIKSKRPWLDQIAIPIAVQSLQLNVLQLESRYNSWPGTEASAIFNHYHRFDRLKDTAPISELLGYFYTHQQLRALLKKKANDALHAWLVASNGSPPPQLVQFHCFIEKNLPSISP